jgi:D-3-phosphoglycerate dehydrogenase
MENGNIVNSVNYPNCELPRTAGATRITVLHKNIPNMISSITSAFAGKGINIENMVNKSRGDYACTILDVENVTDDIYSAILAIDGVKKIFDSHPIINIMTENKVNVNSMDAKKK